MGKWAVGDMAPRAGVRDRAAALKSAQPARVRTRSRPRRGARGRVVGCEVDRDLAQHPGTLWAARVLEGTRNTS